jgi:glycosyltransferase involved in cell wall biosynthesis
LAEEIAAVSDAPKLSVCIIVQDEEAHIEACLESVNWADEIVVVDSWSTDATVAICERFGAKVVQREYTGQVDKKNHAVEQASHDWVLSVDADERITAESAKEIRDVLAANHGPSASQAMQAAGPIAYRIRRRTFYFGREIKHGEWNPDWVVRLFDRRGAKFGGTDPHDHVEPGGPVRDLREPMLHYSYRDYAQQIDRIQAFSGFAAKAYYDRGKRAGFWMLCVRPQFRFFKGYVLKLGFLDGFAGLAVAVGSGFYAFSRAVKLWELQHTNDSQPDSPAGSTKE